MINGDPFLTLYKTSAYVVLTTQESAQGCVSTGTTLHLPLKSDILNERSLEQIIETVEGHDNYGNKIFY